MVRFFKTSAQSRQAVVVAGAYLEKFRSYFEAFAVSGSVQLHHVFVTSEMNPLNMVDNLGFALHSVDRSWR